MKAIVVNKPGKASLVRDRLKPVLREDYLLIKTHAIALNPTDWKHADLTQKPGVLLGCDYAGVVEDVGPKVTKAFKRGDRVMGIVHGGNSIQPEDGAFAEYILAKGDIQAHIPDNMSFEEAATLGVGITTVGQALYQVLQLPLPSDEGVIQDGHTGGPPVLIYGGSTATGIIALQCARLSSFVPITTCSPQNFDLVTSFGAGQAFDYGDEDAAEAIRESTDEKIQHCLDTISLAWTAKFCASSMSSDGGKLVTLHPMRPPSSEIECVDIKAYTVIGEDWGMGDKRFPAAPEDFEFGKTWWSLAEKLLAQGKIRPHRMQVMTGGLQGAIDGMQLLRDAKVSGYKLVYRIEETP